MVSLIKYMSIGIGTKILNCRYPLIVQLDAAGIHSSSAKSPMLLTHSSPANRRHYDACLALPLRIPDTVLILCKGPNLLLLQTLLQRQAGNTWHSGSASAWCGGGFRQARWVRMNGNSPITVQLNAQVPWLVSHYSEPAMLAPVGAPAAKSSETIYPFVNALVTTQNSHYIQESAWA